MEITQFTYFQQCGGFDLSPITVEITYGLERICMYLQGVDSMYDIRWNDRITYGDVHHRGEVEFSTYNFEQADVQLYLKLFGLHEAECKQLCAKKLPLPAYDNCLRCSHVFNVLDARRAIGVTERQAYIGRVRALAHLCAESFLAVREDLGFPILKRYDTIAPPAVAKE